MKTRAHKFHTYIISTRTERVVGSIITGGAGANGEDGAGAVTLIVAPAFLLCLKSVSFRFNTQSARYSTLQISFLKLVGGPVPIFGLYSKTYFTSNEEGMLRGSTAVKGNSECICVKICQ
jgi:hypothetical protein